MVWYTLFMCGRYQFDFSDRIRFQKRYNLQSEYPYSEIKTRYNVAPGQKMPVVLSHSPNTVEIMLWGFIPGWDKSERPKGFINLRDDTVTGKKWAWRYLKHQRCLIPASGFYEWQKGTGGKTPYYITAKQEDYISFAGLYSEWKHPQTNESKKTYAIITTSPNPFMEPIHNRMPVILARSEEEHWLNPDNTEIDSLKELLHPYKGEMDAYSVSKRVNSPYEDDDTLIKPETQGKLL